MKAITISQPYASLIASGEKRVENRTWSTGYRGWLAIHAGKGTQYLDRHELQAYPTSCIVAVAYLAACVSLESLQRIAAKDADAEIAGCVVSRILDHDHTEGPICWILRGATALEEPIPCTGARGLWYPPMEIELRLNKLVEELTASKR